MKKKESNEIIKTLRKKGTSEEEKNLLRNILNQNKNDLYNEENYKKNKEIKKKFKKNIAKNIENGKNPFFPKKSKKKNNDINSYKYNRDYKETNFRRKIQ